jgi:hypothetical protein
MQFTVFYVSLKRLKCPVNVFILLTLNKDACLRYPSVDPLTLASNKEQSAPVNICGCVRVVQKENVLQWRVELIE